MTTYHLTRIDVAALRKAERITFAFTAEGGAKAMGWAPAVKTEDDPYAPSERCYSVQCEALMTDFVTKGAMGSWADYGRGCPHEACTTVYRSNTALATMTRFLKPGDRLTLRWQAGALNSSMLTEKGLRGDSFEVWVSRGDDVEPWVFKLEVELSHATDTWHYVKLGEAARKRQDAARDAARAAELVA
jgi:hypothetical protein